MSRFFKRVFHATDYTPSQCTPNFYRAVIYFDNLNRFFEVRAAKSMPNFVRAKRSYSTTRASMIMCEALTC
ncbi:PREDICTED: LRR receptor serine/threonine- [Prunus dulcis]|uniref:PREDICTED: LRR receptor serine/threonine n=1 Tax=Prunus dulcis TaxID=3755 RepID=A0A5E4G8F6_PRUDU|nr:PREDICTED: LRR receptor serine/threonine- [Prunus dulcis]